MKVLHICTSDSGGAGLCCLRIHNSLLLENVDSKVLVLEKSRKSDSNVFSFGYKRYLIWRILNKILRKLNINLTEFNTIFNLNIKYSAFYSCPTSVIDVTKHKLVKDADIIHLHFIDGFVDYPSFFKKINKPIVWTLHDENLFYGIAHYSKNVINNHPLEIKYKAIKQNIISNTKNLGIVFLSQMMYNNFSDKKFIENCYKTVINNSVNYDFFHPYDKKSVRKEFNIAQDTKVFIFVAAGIFDKRKGLDILVDAIKKLQLKNVLILAVGKNKNNYEWDFTRIIGPVYDSDKLSKLYSCADFFVMPSMQEAFAQTPLEAMACGIPAIVFPVSGTQELINEKNGVICKDFTSESLQEGIKIALNTKYDSALIRQDMINRFSPKVIAIKYLDFYKKIIFQNTNH